MTVMVRMAEETVATAQAATTAIRCTAGDRMAARVYRMDTKD